MTDKQTEALKLALEALEESHPEAYRHIITAIREALAEQSAQQEPVAWMHPDGRIWTFGRGFDKSTFTIPLYTSPPASKPWAGLTEEDIRPMCKQDWVFDTVKQWAQIIEAKLREKNA